MPPIGNVCRLRTATPAQPIQTMRKQPRAGVCERNGPCTPSASIRQHILLLRRILRILNGARGGRKSPPTVLFWKQHFDTAQPPGRLLAAQAGSRFYSGLLHLGGSFFPAESLHIPAWQRCPAVRKPLVGCSGSCPPPPSGGATFLATVNPRHHQDLQGDWPDPAQELWANTLG